MKARLCSITKSPITISRRRPGDVRSASKRTSGFQRRASRGVYAHSFVCCLYGQPHERLLANAKNPIRYPLVRSCSPVNLEKPLDLVELVQVRARHVVVRRDQEEVVREDRGVVPIETAIEHDVVGSDGSEVGPQTSKALSPTQEVK
jgi:hypothetical protein